MICEILKRTHKNESCLFWERIIFIFPLYNVNDICNAFFVLLIFLFLFLYRQLGMSHDSCRIYNRCLKCACDSFVTRYYGDHCWQVKRVTGVLSRQLTLCCFSASPCHPDISVSFKFHRKTVVSFIVGTERVTKSSGSSNTPARNSTFGVYRNLIPNSPLIKNFILR